MSLAEFTRVSETPYFPLSRKPETINVGGFNVLQYIPPEQMDRYIKDLSDKVKLSSFEAVLVNMNGGLFLFDRISAFQNYHKAPVAIEYHRPDGGFGARIVKAVPDRLKGKKILAIDDIYDSGGVLQSILAEVAPESRAAVLVTKIGIENQIPIPNIVLGLKIDNVWIGGCGMDLGVPGEEQTFRSYPGIVVNSCS